MASEELRKSRLQRAKDFAGRARSHSSDKISAEELSAIKKKADDLDAIQNSVSEAAAVGAPLWLSYIFLLFYIAIAAGAVTHKELLLESPVDLPFLNIKLPLKAFFILAPILFLIVHAYVLAHFAMLSDKAKAFHDRLTAKINAEVENDHAIREGLRQQLPINVFVQFLAGPTDIRESAFGVMLWVIAWTTLVGAPVLVLLLLQLQFLPYHDTRVTWLHRVVLCIDLAVVWWLWMKILAGRDRSKPKDLDRWMTAWDDFLWFFRKFGAQFATMLVAIFSVLIATFPGEWEDWPFRLPQKLEHRIAAATDFIFGKVDALNQNENKRVTGKWPANTLRLREFDIYAALGMEGGKPYSFNLKDRHLEHADLRDARFDNIDLRGAGLRGVLLDRSKLEGANLDLVNLAGASLSGATLQSASFKRAQLQGASLRGTQLRGACLESAALQGASLEAAALQGASFEAAALQGASLANAELQGASLKGAELQGALLGGAKLTGASLARANLQGASFQKMDEFRVLNIVFLHTFDRGSLKGISLEGANLWRVEWDEADLINARPMLLEGVRWESSDAQLPFPREPWTDRAYGNLSALISTIRNGVVRDKALERIRRLDCRAIGEDLAPCDPNIPLPEKVGAWRELLGRAAADRAEHTKFLSTYLRDLVCGSEGTEIHILHGVSRRTSDFWPDSRLSSVGPEAATLIDDILTGANCSVAASLTAGDKARLQQIKAELRRRSLPPPSLNAVSRREPSSAASQPFGAAGSRDRAPP